MFLVGLLVGLWLPDDFFEFAPVLLFDEPLAPLFRSFPKIQIIFDYFTCDGLRGAFAEPLTRLLQPFEQLLGDGKFKLYAQSDAPERAIAR